MKGYFQNYMSGKSKESCQLVAKWNVVDYCINITSEQKFDYSDYLVAAKWIVENKN